MSSWFDGAASRRRRQEKQDQREKAVIAADELLSREDVVFYPTSQANALSQQSAEKVCEQLARGELSSAQLVATFSRRALDAHAELNCLTEVLVGDALVSARRLDDQLAATGPVGPMHGLPISIKDCLAVRGYDVCVGYSTWINKPMAEDSVIVQCLRRAGAIPYVKTNVPQTLLAFESENPVFGRTLNPHNHQYAPGGSSGGEAALLAADASILGVGSDIGGSLRIPAHFSGVYALKPSADRLPNFGSPSPGKGQEAIKATCGPMARDVAGLAFFMKTVLDQEPWTEDTACIPLPWRPWSPPEQLCFGYYTYNGALPAAPACQRAVHMAVEALRAAGHQVVEFKVPDGLEAVLIFHGLLSADGGQALLAPIGGDPLSPPVAALKYMAMMPYLLRMLLAWYIRRHLQDSVMAQILLATAAKGHTETRSYVCRRDAYRNLFAREAREAGMKLCGRPFDAIISPGFALPAVPHDSSGDVLTASSYTNFHNTLDLPAGVVPITTVDRDLDRQHDGVSWLGEGVRIGMAEQKYRQYYDADKMHGLPLGVQVFAERYQEEKVVACMQVLDDCVKRYGSSASPSSGAQA
ncbi:amidase [Thamnocephalis sphaerospora]|uniref:amidase n=1 Tax=Thamnocephalis sphaerospora TaxID=78915 RepID=A0A4P9XLS0_9FUNG|nr:amidase [Thamnocephalis sphaerospora]|eukprot:RKP06837.1 amidase [Thamnocephalis sphaerospora]